MPTPGSPPISVVEPRMNPPPSTRSSSPLPEATRSPGSASIAASGTASGASPAAAAVAEPASTSRKLFHSPQLGQRPSHLGSRRSQEAQTNRR